MALSRKYSTLPDLDTAPDVYETPELTDDNSTVLTTTGISPSDDESDVDNDNTGISRSRVQIGQARSRFQRADVDARGVDFSDRIDGKRKAYRTTVRRHRSPHELGDLTDEDSDEDGNKRDGGGSSSDNLERKIARLKRAAEEIKEVYTSQKAGDKEGERGSEDTSSAALESLSQMLDEIARLSEQDSSSVKAAATKRVPMQVSAPALVVGSSSLLQPAPPSLAQVADFDRRLVLLERSIGVGSSMLLPGIDDGNGSATPLPPRAILPTLDVLQRQISTLADASTASLDGISRRVRALTQEADELIKSRQAAKAAQEALVQAGVQGAGAGAGSTGGPTIGAAGDDPDQTAKINALYGTLSTIENLTPLLPLLLDRLRSLQAIHADAASASELLDGLEQRQAEMAAEVRQWREGLDKIEIAMHKGEATMGKNMQVMEGWVKGLETRLDKV